MSLALLFPGQATQHPAMLSWLDTEPEAAETLALLAQRIGGDWRSRLAEENWATGNRVAQSLLTGLSLAAWRCLSPRLPRPTVIAGYSVGELPAFSAAGVFDAATALALASDRAEAMDRSVAGLDTGLLAVTGAAADAIEQTCQHHGLAIAIESAIDRWVLGGAASALDAAAAQLTREGARCQRLAVRLASHTPCLLSAKNEFSLRLRRLPFKPPNTTLVCNRSGAAVRGEAQLKAMLAEQIAHPVHWAACLETIAQQRPRCVLEVGPGSSLSALWNTRFPEIPARSIDEFRSPDGIAAWVNRVSATD